MNDLFSKMVYLYNTNKVGIISLLFFTTLMNFVLKLEDTSISIVLFILIFIGYTVNEIIVIKTYISKLLNNSTIEYNNFKTIFLNSFKVYLKYILIIIILLMIVLIPMFLYNLDFNLIENKILSEDIISESDVEVIIEDYVLEFADSFFSKPLINIIIYFTCFLLFFKLLFVEHILLFKQNIENYRIKYLVKKSYSIIQKEKTFFCFSYFGVNIICIVFEEILFKNIFIIPFFTGIIGVLLFMVFLIKFGDIISSEYDKTEINIVA
jgi:hypothetical protein